MLKRIQDYYIDMIGSVEPESNAVRDVVEMIYDRMLDCDMSEEEIRSILLPPEEDQ